jgi:5'-phosphate synthase pdxT subunit
VTVGVLALQGDVREHRAAFAELGEDVRPVRRPGDVEGLSGIVLPGGESTTLSLLLDTTGLAGVLEEALRDGLPAFGTCAGMILLAGQVLDGRSDQHQLAAIDLTVRRNAYGHQAASFEADLEVPAIGPAPLHAVFIRAPVVEAVGPDVAVLATLPPASPAPSTELSTPSRGQRGQRGQVGRNDPVHAGPRGRPVLCRHGSVLVSAFHPELTTDRRLHRLFLDMIKDDARPTDPARSDRG